ncbi:MAG: RsmB/NOP family class I SAM-dependent RNA methyltransferase [Rhodobacteraceae bacterium]|nr:RsmB/NOP family class I SAM-dependent RNA methyltransferase [Paracoccaceae bacterium]
MTPTARLSAAITLLDQILTGDPAERALTRWARASRFAGSKDRAGVRDIVFDALRRKRSLSHLAGEMTGRGLVMAQQYSNGEALEELFGDFRFAPAAVTVPELEQLANPGVAPNPVKLDYPDFLNTELERSLGADLPQIMQSMQSRAPVDLRVNTLKTTVEEAQNYLARDLIFSEPISGVKSALRITENPRKLNGSLAYKYGFVELQDVSSQLVSQLAGAAPGTTVLDYCAGGGGKTLALAAEMQGRGKIFAHDANPLRMKDLPERARRAGADIQVISPDHIENSPKCDLVFVDAPCSGSGAWRRNPDSKWRITDTRLGELVALQREILQKAQARVGNNGVLAYATCSLFAVENSDQITWFLSEYDGWKVTHQQSLSPITGGDGFFISVLCRTSR